MLVWGFYSCCNPGFVITCTVHFLWREAGVENSQVCVKKVVVNCINILPDKNVVPVFIAEINCKLRSGESTKFSYALSLANTLSTVISLIVITWASWSDNPLTSGCME